MKEFKIGQAVFIVMPAELMSLEVMGVTIVPAIILNQSSINGYNVTIQQKVLNNKLVVHVHPDIVHATIKEASDQCMTFITGMLEEEARKVKDLAKTALYGTKDCADVIFDSTTVLESGGDIEEKAKDVDKHKSINLGELEQAKRKEDGLD
jgi:NAD-dependent DNA ligase